MFGTGDNHHELGNNYAARLVRKSNRLRKMLVPDVSWLTKLHLIIECKYILSDVQRR